MPRGDSQESNLKVDSLASLLTGGDRGPALVVGKPNESILIQAIRHDDTLQMPPDRKLPQAVINDLMLWVSEGAVWPDAGPVTVAAKQLALSGNRPMKIASSGPFAHPCDTQFRKSPIRGTGLGHPSIGSSYRS